MVGVWAMSAEDGLVDKKERNRTKQACEHLSFWSAREALACHQTELVRAVRTGKSGRKLKEETRFCLFLCIYLCLFFVFFLSLILSLSFSY